MTWYKVVLKPAGGCEIHRAIDEAIKLSETLDTWEVVLEFNSIVIPVKDREAENIYAEWKSTLESRQAEREKDSWQKQ